MNLTSTEKEIMETLNLTTKEALRRLKLIEKELRENLARGFLDTKRGEPIYGLLSKLVNVKTVVKLNRKE